MRLVAWIIPVKYLKTCFSLSLSLSKINSLQIQWEACEINWELVLNDKF
jgi:hypothetical protein